MANPPITTETVASLREAGIRAAKAVSKDQLDFAEGSPGTVLMEGFAIVAAQIQSQINQLADTIELNRLALFGIEKRTGVPAVGTINVRLAGSYVEPFQLPAGFEVEIAGVTFETISNLTIPAYTTDGAVSIAALEAGTAGNLPVGSSIRYSLPDKVSVISLVDGTQGGTDNETDEEWQERVQRTIRTRDALVSVDDFQEDVIDQLGDGSTAIAVGKLMPDRNTYENGYVFVFALNPDGSPLNTAQVAQLQESLTRKAPMATISVDSLETLDIDVKVYAGFSGSADAIASEIRTAVNNFFVPANINPGGQISHKAIEYEVQSIEGVRRGVVSVTLNKFEQPLSLPNPWTIGVVKSLAITLVDSQGNEFIL